MVIQLQKPIMVIKKRLMKDVLAPPTEEDILAHQPN